MHVAVDPLDISWPARLPYSIIDHFAASYAKKKKVFFFSYVFVSACTFDHCQPRSQASPISCSSVCIQDNTRKPKNEKQGRPGNKTNIKQPVGIMLLYILAITDRSNNSLWVAAVTSGWKIQELP